MTEPAPQLEYAPPLPLRRRKVFRRAMLVMAFIVLVAICWIALPRYWQNTKAMMEQRRWMAYTRPADRIVFEPPGPKAMELWKPGAGYLMLPGAVFHDTGLPGELMDAFFVHCRRRPDGRVRLIWISFGYVNGANPPRFKLDGDGYIPATIASPAQRIGHTDGPALPVDAAGKPPRLYAGQADPDDESHFTIRYEFEADGRSGVIHGWLRDEDTINFEFKEEPQMNADKRR